jgi:hypothetical protein
MRCIAAIDSAPTSATLFHMETLTSPATFIAASLRVGDRLALLVVDQY